VSREEKRNAVDAMLRLHPERVNRWIARDVGVSHHTVEARRQQLEKSGQIAQLNFLEDERGNRWPREVDVKVADCEHGLFPGKVHCLEAVEEAGEICAVLCATGASWQTVTSGAVARHGAPGSARRGMGRCSSRACGRDGNIRPTWHNVQGCGRGMAATVLSHGQTIAAAPVRGRRHGQWHRRPSP